jgi:hypothetical protein
VNYWEKASSTQCWATYQVIVGGKSNSYSLVPSQGWTNIDFVVPSLPPGSQTITFRATGYSCSLTGAILDDVSVKAE